MKITLTCLLLLLVFGYSTETIGDGDFWWHLKQGEWMVENHSLLRSDPFSYTSALSDSYSEQLRLKFIMTQYWLSDVIFYLTYSAFGIKGNIILRAMLYMLLLVFVIIRMRLQNVNFHVSLILSALMGYVLITYLGDRPQIFSFFAASVLMLLLQYLNGKLSSGNYRSYDLIAIPLLMLFWANLHGGFIMGIFILFVSAVAEIAKNRIYKHTYKKLGYVHEGSALKIYMGVTVGAMAVSLVNPNTYKVIPLLMDMEGSIFVKTIDEYFSVVKYMKYVSPRPLIIFLILAIPTVSLMIKSRSTDITGLLVFISLGLISFFSVRFLVFFSIWTIPLMGVCLSHELEKIPRPNKRLEGFSQIFRRTRFLEIVAALFLIYFFMANVREDRFFRFNVYYNEFFPSGAVRFIKDAHPKPNMFNNLLSGGYLIWELHPKYQVFMDGRTFSKKIYYDHDSILWAGKGGASMPDWKELLNTYSVNFILTFSLEPHTGRLYRLIPALIGDKGWRLVYMDDYSLVFVKNSEENNEIIRKFGIPNEFGWNEVIVEASRGIRRNPGNIQYYITMGDAYFMKRDYRNALGAYTAAEHVNPRHLVVSQRLLLLKRLGY